MIDVDSLLIWHKFNCYQFDEKTHTYLYNGVPVKYSVTQFVHNFFDSFDKDLIGERYAKKHGLLKEDVVASWDLEGEISSTTGTIVHSFLENAKRGKAYSIEDLSNEEVKKRLEILLPKARQFHQDTLNKLFPIQLEYTVGIENAIAGNVDMLCWNEKAQEFQIWDYKNSKEIKVSNSFGKIGFGAFSKLQDCNFSKYSVQLNIYKAIIQRVLGVSIGKCYLVHFNYTNDDSYQIYECLDLQVECNEELDKLVEEAKNS